MRPVTSGHRFGALLLAALLVGTWTGSALHLALEAHHLAHHVAQGTGPHAARLASHAGHAGAEHTAGSHAPHDAAEHLPPPVATIDPVPAPSPAPPAAAGFVALPAPRPLRWVPRDQVPEPDSDPPLRPAPPRAPPVG